jgi:hypothetical protein
MRIGDYRTNVCGTVVDETRLMKRVTMLGAARQTFEALSMSIHVISSPLIFEQLRARSSLVVPAAAYTVLFRVA